MDIEIMMNACVLSQRSLILQMTVFLFVLVRWICKNGGLQGGMRGERWE